MASVTLFGGIAPRIPLINWQPYVSNRRVDQKSKYSKIITNSESKFRFFFGINMLFVVLC